MVKSLLSIVIKITAGYNQSGERMIKDDVDSGLIFIDMLTSFEKIGDHAFNVAEGISGKRVF